MDEAIEPQEAEYFNLFSYGRCTTKGSGDFPPELKNTSGGVYHGGRGQQRHGGHNSRSVRVNRDHRAREGQTVTEDRRASEREQGHNTPKHKPCPPDCEVCASEQRALERIRAKTHRYPKDKPKPKRKRRRHRRLRTGNSKITAGHKVIFEGNDTRANRLWSAMLEVSSVLSMPGEDKQWLRSR